MRYTTIIDITEFREVYRSISCRLVYLHLALKASYQDADRDEVTASIRSLEADTGLTMAAVRHAMKKLEACGLTKYLGASRWKITKWTPTLQPTPRRQVKTSAQNQDAARKREESRLERERQAALQHSGFDDRMEVFRQHWEQDPGSMMGKIYANYLEEKNQKKKKND